MTAPWIAFVQRWMRLAIVIFNGRIATSTYDLLSGAGRSYTLERRLQATNQLTQFAIRLAGSGATATQGRLEVFYNSEWGTVCDDGFSEVNAQVACRHLGYSGGIWSTSGWFGAGSGRIWIDNLNCAGHETRLDECAHNGWGSHNCAHSEDVGISCSNPAPGGAGGTWTVVSGSCTTVEAGSCVQSPNYPGHYSNGDRCTIEASSGLAINVDAFDTEANYDFLYVNGVGHSGTIGPSGLVPTGNIVWTTDHSVTDPGWKLCAQPAFTPAPTPATTQECGETIAAVTCGTIAQPPFELVDNEYAWLPQGHGNVDTEVAGADYVSFDFYCQDSADGVTFSMEVIAPTGTDDSFFVGLDGTANVWHIPGRSSTWSWELYAPHFSVSAGWHQLRIYPREDGTKLRRVAFASELSTCFFPATCLSGYQVVRGINANAAQECHSTQDHLQCQDLCRGDPLCQMYEMDAALQNGSPGLCCLEHCRPPTSSIAGPTCNLRNTRDGSDGWMTTDEFSNAGMTWNDGTSHVGCQASVVQSDWSPAQDSTSATAFCPADTWVHKCETVPPDAEDGVEVSLDGTGCTAISNGGAIRAKAVCMPTRTLAVQSSDMYLDDQVLSATCSDGIPLSCTCSTHWGAATICGGDTEFAPVANVCTKSIPVSSGRRRNTQGGAGAKIFAICVQTTTTATTTTATTTASLQSQSGISEDNGAITGSTVVGIVVGIVVTGLVMCFCCRKRFVRAADRASKAQIYITAPIPPKPTAVPSLELITAPIPPKPTAVPSLDQHIRVPMEAQTRHTLRTEPQSSHCSQCGSALGPGAAFCTSCGTPTGQARPTIVGNAMTSPMASPVASPRGPCLAHSDTGVDEIFQQVEDASTLKALAAMLIPPACTKKTLGYGADVRKTTGTLRKYDLLELETAWEIYASDQRDFYRTKKKQVAKQMRMIDEKNEGCLRTAVVPTLLDSNALHESLALDDSVNEKLLLHGTNADTVMKITRSGFDEKCTSRAAFGNGAYFAEDPSKVDQYCQPDSADTSDADAQQLHELLYGNEEHPGDVCYVVVCQAVLGCPMYTKHAVTDRATGEERMPKSIQGPTDSCLPDQDVFVNNRHVQLTHAPHVSFPHHSLVVLAKQAEDYDVKRHREFVIFDGKAILPKFLVSYRRASTPQPAISVETRRGTRRTIGRVIDTE